jgi:hypothetical protein
MDVLRSLSSVVLFNEKAELTLLVGWRDGRVRANNRFAFVVLENFGVRRLDDKTRGDREEGGFVIRQLENKSVKIEVRNWMPAGTPLMTHSEVLWL